MWERHRLGRARRGLAAIFEHFELNLNTAFGQKYNCVSLSRVRGFYIRVYKSRIDCKRLNFVREQGGIRFESGAYTKYVSILNRIPTQLSGKR
jgi:hypothetical protein